jgi:cell division protein FtsQ
MSLLKRTKRKNRRVPRDVNLDVRLSTDQVRSRRLRVTGRVLSIVFAFAAVVLTLAYGGKVGFNYFLFENPAYTLKRVLVTTDGAISADLLRAWMELPPSPNLYALKLNTVEQKLKRIPWVKRVESKRILPDTLVVRVLEREPVAQLISADLMPDGSVQRRIIQVDATGWTMPELDNSRRAVQLAVPEVLPTLTGLSLTDSRSTARVLDQPSVKAALDLIREFDISPMAGMVELAEIDVSRPGILRVLTTQRTEVFFDVAEVPAQLRRWRAIQDTLAAYGKAAASVDLSISNNVPVRYVEASNIPNVPPRGNRPSRTRNRHV